MFKALAVPLFRAAGIECNSTRPWDPQILDDRFYRRVLLHGSLGLGDSYIDGWWTCRDIGGMINRLLRSGIPDLVPRFDDLLLKLRSRFVDGQDRVRSKRVAEEHYNEDPSFFIDVLGRTNSYTCARWDNVDTLDAAQEQKMDLLCRKAELAPGKTVLDIGCGWGGFLGHACGSYGVQGIGLSISAPQLEYARAKYHNLPIDFRLQDYRDFNGTVDSVVSICMIEHVGPRHYREYFEKARAALRDNGIFALQCIIARKDRSMNDPWVDRHIFPNGNLVTLDRLRNGVQGLFHILDEEYFGMDYAKTLSAWYDNLVRNRAAIITKYGVEHFRKYEYYFQAFIGGFRSGRVTVGQFVLSPTPRPDYVPVRL